MSSVKISPDPSQSSCYSVTVQLQSDSPVQTVQFLFSGNMGSYNISPIHNTATHRCWETITDSRYRMSPSFLHSKHKIRYILRKQLQSGETAVSVLSAAKHLKFHDYPLTSICPPPAIYQWVILYLQSVQRLNIFTEIWNIIFVDNAILTSPASTQCWSVQPTTMDSVPDLSTTSQQRSRDWSTWPGQELGTFKQTLFILINLQNSQN